MFYQEFLISDVSSVTELWEVATVEVATALSCSVILGVALVFFPVQFTRGKRKLTAYLFKCIPLSSPS